MDKIKIGRVDDHQLFLKSLTLMLVSFDTCSVVLEAINGLDLKEKVAIRRVEPDIWLIDVNMPYMDGVATVSWLREQYPASHLVALSLNDTDKSIINMIRAGCCAYLLKDIHPNVLENAINEIFKNGYFIADISKINYRRLLQSEANDKRIQIIDREEIFMQFACSDKTYKQIGSEMFVSERTIDGYRDSLFAKFGVESRIGLSLVLSDKFDFIPRIYHINCVSLTS